MNTGKRKLGNRIISVFLALLLLFTMIPANALSVAAMSGEPSSVGDESATTAEETTEKTDETTTEGEKTPEESTTAEESTTKETESEPQPEDNHLKIVVKDTLGNPISGVSVTIGSDTLTTDSNGVADFGEKEDGSYSVVVSKEGYIETIESITNGDVHRFEIILSSDTAEASDVEMKGTVTADGVVNNDAVASVTVYDLTNSTSEELALDSAGAFSVFLTVGARYKITVTPKNEKAFAPVSKEFTATESIASEYASYNLISEKYTVTLNGKTVGQYKYGEKCTADIGRTGYTVEAGSVDVTENGTKIAYDRDGDTVSFNVTGDTVITASYTYTASFKIDGKGDIVIDDEKKKENIDITKNDGETVRYTINADAGYYIKSLTVDGDAVSVPGEKTTYSGTVNKNSQISVVFGEIQYKVTIAISNSAEKKGSASVSVDAAELVSVNDSGEDGSNSKVYTVGIKNFADNKHTLTLKTQVKDKYVLEYSVGGAQRKEVQNNEIVLGNIKEDTTVNLYVVPVAYTLTYVDPLASESVTEVEFTVESGEFTLPSPNKKGYTFIGWSEAVPDGFTKDTKGLLNGKYDYEKFSGDTTLYAVYTINAADAKAKSVVTYLNKAEDKAVEYSYSTDSDKKVTDEISDAWFGNDVTVELTTLEGVELTAVGTDEGKEPITYTVDENNRFVLKTVDGECVSTAVEISGSITHKCTVAETEVAIEYAAEKSTFTVQRDAVAPDFEVKNNTQTNADEMKASDKDSGLKAVEYAVISTNAPLYKDILEKVENKDFGYVESLKEKLRAETWNEITADEDSVYRHSYTLTDDIYVVYRAVDEAGNDVYSSFDLTVPKIDSVKYSFTDNAGSHEVSEGSVYTSGNVTFEVTVSDRRLFYIDKSNENYTYNGCKLVIYERGNSTNDIVLDDTTAVEKWSPFKDKWVATFTVDKDSEAFKNLLDKELTFAVTAEDQAGNKAVSYTDSAKIVFVETKAPEITVDYQYANGEQKLNAACAAGEKLFSSEDVVACIEVGKDNFDPYANGDSAASVVVKVDGKVAGDVSWTKTSEKWTAEVPVADEGEHVVTVEATSQAGTAASYTSGSIVIDKTAPEIKIEYSNTQNDVYSDGESSFNNGNKDTLTATITVSDNYLRPVTGEGQKTKAVVKVGDTQKEVTWNETDTVWTTSVELTKEEGAYTLTAEAADQAGNGKTESSTFCNDNTAPEVTGVSLSYAQGNKILNILTFGIFFNDVVKVTVSAQDGSEAYCSGLKTIELLFNDKADNMTADVFTAGEDESLVAEFTIPEETLEGLPNNWENNLGVRVTDQVGNENELKINEVDENDGIDTDSVLYETNKPTSSISFEKYVAEGREWLMINESVKISVTDIAEGELCSGIDEVRITVAGGGNTVTLASDDFSGNDTIEKSHEYTFDYKQFEPGKNEITVVVIDNAGNENEETVYTVYKDKAAPDITCDTANADVFYSGAGKLWVKNNKNIEIHVKDAVFEGDTDKEFTSGLKKASVSVGETEVANLTADGTLVVEYGDLADGKNVITVNTVDNSGNTNSATYIVYKDVDAPVFTYDTTDADVFYPADGKLWVKDGKAFKISAADEVIDDDTENARTSGLKNAKVTVTNNGEVIKEYSEDTGIFTVEYTELTAGENIITITARDNADNESTETVTVYKDTDAPVFNSVKFAYVEKNRILNVLTFGIFFNAKVVVTVGCSDSASGVNNVELLNGTEVLGTGTLTDEGYVFEIPNKEADGTDWEAILSVRATDNVGNTSDAKPVNEIDENDDVKNNNAVYETNKPTSSISFEKYVAEGREWLMVNESVKITVTDIAEDKLCSGIDEVRITVTGGGKTVTLASDDFSGNDTIEKSHEYTFDYESFAAGKNEITVVVIDNAGNENEKTVYTVYKDEAEPVITCDTANADVFYSGAGKLWVMNNKNIEINVKDAVIDGDTEMQFTSGLKEASVSVGETEVDNLTADGTLVVEYGDLAEGQNTITVNTVDNSGNTNSAEYTVYKDITVPVFTYDTTDEKVFYHDNRVQENPKLWLMKEKDISIDVKDAVFADDTENTRTSGLKIAKVTVSQPEGTVSREYSSTTGEFTVKYADLTPGENTVTIYACDNSGYEITQTITVYKDVYEPTIDAISIEPSENADSPVRKILNKLTFGIFFNAKVKVMLECNDAEPSAGIKQVVLLYNDGKDTITGEYKGSVYVFELPDGKSAEQWTAELSASAVDHVGNTCATTPIKDIKTGDLDDIYSDTVLYEKKAPTITYDYADYAKDTDNNSLYFDTATKTYWMIKDGTIDIAVDDNKNNEIDKKFVSGLNNVTVKISGTVDGEKAEKDLVSESYSDSYTVNKTYTVSYDDLYEGKNVITVRAEDNSCNISETITDNSAKETTIVIYKDSKDPTINGVKIYRAEQVNGENRIITRRSYGNFYNGAVRIAVSLLDEKFSSGIESLSLKYVYTDENGKKGTIDGVMETKADDKEQAKKDAKKEAENEDKVLNAADTKEDVTAEYTFTLEPLTKKDKDGNDVLVDTEGYLVITVVDNTGNSYTFDDNTGKEDDAWPLDTDGDDAKSNILVNSLMFENNKVTFEAALSDATYSCDNRDNETDNHLWYKNTDVNYTVTVRDTLDRDSGLLNSGLKSVKIVVKNANGETTAVDVNLGNSKDDKEPVYEETYDFNLKDNGGAEGQNIITVTSVDNSNNSSSHSVTLYIDETRPVVDFFSFKGVNGNQELTYDKCKTVTKTDYGYFFSKDTEVTVYVSDKCPSSGISKVYFVAIPAENAKPSTSMDTAQSLVTECCVKGTENGGIYSASATFKVKANFKGQIYAYVEDNVGYTSLDMSKTGYDQWVRPDGLIVETQAMHNQMSEHIKIEILSTPVTYLNGSKNPLFAGDVKLRLSVDDSYSGIREVTYNVVAGHDTGKNFTETLVTKNGTRGWTSESDINLTTFLSKEITVSNNSNDIKIYLSMVDNSGNVTTNENDPLVISIDKDAPEVSVSFTPDDSGDDAEFTGFFKTDRTMTVKVKERNFSKDLVKITATADERPYAIAPDFDKGVEVVENGIQYFIYTMTYVFHNDADYTFAIAASDKAENKTADEQVNYGSAAAKTVAKKFTVDQTLPEITVNISGQKGKDIYYKGDVTVEVTVVEHNYEEGRYNAVFTMRNPQSGVPEKVSMPTPSISGGGDVWHHTYVFTMEYMSNLESIKVVDMAGNEKDTYNGNYAGEDFVVDKTDPTIQFFTNSDMQNKLDRTATKSKTVTPYIVIKDTNLDVYDEGDYDIQLKGNYNGPGLSGKEDYTFSYIRDPFDPTVLTIGFNNFANKEDVDDIYTFTITAVDKAGCVTTESVIFSVNRYGSTFMVSEDTEVLLSKYYTNSPQDISIVQINAAEISDQRVSVTKNGIASDLTQGEDYTVTNKAPGTKATTGEKNTDSNWYESTYIINKDNFNDEGIYSVTVYSKDTAKSVLTSATSKRTMYLFKDTQRNDKAVLVDEKALEAPVNFQIDKTAPTASIVDIEDGKQYFTGSKEFTVYADDSVSLKDAVISIDGESQTYSAEEIKSGVTQVIQKDDAGKFQTIKVEAHDTAGNVYTSEASIQVTTNIPAWFAENEIAQITVAIVALMLIIFIIIIMKRRKSRDK